MLPLHLLFVSLWVTLCHVLILSLALILIPTPWKILVVLPNWVIWIPIVLLASSSLSISYKIYKVRVCTTYLNTVITSFVDLKTRWWLLKFINLRGLLSQCYVAEMWIHHILHGKSLCSPSSHNINLYYTCVLMNYRFHSAMIPL